MIEKIISGGQTGADQAALDAAIKLGNITGPFVRKRLRKSLIFVVQIETHACQTNNSD
jgi:hypothetical protein